MGSNTQYANVGSNKTTTIDLLSLIDRHGMDSLLDYLENSDYYRAPASTRYHNVFEGGLCQRSKITPIFGAVARIFIKSCKKQPAICRIKLCSECCALRENENLYLIALRRA